MTDRYVRLVIDDSATLAASFFCCQPVNNGPCMRRPNHRGGHMPLLNPMPRRLVDADNPAYPRSAA